MKGSLLSLKERKNNNIGFPAFKLPQRLNYFMTDPLNIIFDEFGIYLLGYRIEFSCLYIPQGLYSISNLWLWSTDEYVFLSYFENIASLIQGYTLVK